MIETFSPGDYVVYDNRQVGRVASVRADTCFVCYSTGCTAASTPASLLTHATAEEAARAEAKHGPLGHHRFDPACPDYDDAVCAAYCPDKRKKKG